MIAELLPQLAEAIAADFEGKAPGHCVRVDDLDSQEADHVCSEIRHKAPGLDCFVLAPQPIGGVQLALDQAVELRNRKKGSLCLIVPLELRDFLPESLENAFARFDIPSFLARERDKLISELPQNLQDVARSLKSLLRGRATVSAEAFIEYLGGLSRDPRPDTAGRELWRVGLVPDLDVGFASRLARNRHAVEAIARPLRPQSPPRERLLRAGLATAFTNRLARYLADKPLYQTETWQRPVADDACFEQFSFHLWEFPGQALSNLQEIRVQPFVDAKGGVQKYCYLEQLNGAGTQLVASRGKVAVRWESEPPTPQGVANWCVAMIPSRLQYPEDFPADLPVRVRKAGPTARKTASLSLDFQADEAGVRAVQIKVTALDEGGAEVCNPDGRVIENLSGEFWLTSDPGEPDEGEERIHARSEVSLAVGRLETTLNLPDDAPSIEESAPGWDTKDFYYFHVCLNGREEKRIATSEALAELQDRMLKHPRSAWYSIDVEPDAVLHARDIQADALPEDFAADPVWAEFFKRRRSLFEALRAHEPRSRVESLEWDQALAEDTRRYARAYRELLEALSDKGEVAALLWALRTDTLAVRVVSPGGRTQEATLILPLQPLRLLWYGAYALLLESWRQKLGELPHKSKRGSVELDFIRALSPQNLPPFVPANEAGIHLFSHNLGLFTGIALPLEVEEPGRAIAILARIVGVPSDLGRYADLSPHRVSRAIAQYLELHPDRRALRIGAANPGDAIGLADAIGGSLATGEEGSEETPGLSELDLVAHCPPPLPIALPGLDRLRDALYATERGGQRTHLQPRCQCAIRKLDDLTRLPGGDLHLSLLFDWSQPKFKPAPVLPGENSASLYGLITRLCSRFESSDSHARWVHQLVLHGDSARDRHPVVPGLTTELVDGQMAYLRAVGRLRGLTVDQGHAPSLVVEIDHEQRNRLDQIHYRSDWVLLIDRFLGVEIFDAPRDPYLAQVSQKYLLDYAPEFQEGLGHRMVITTAWREEVQHLLGAGLRELGFDAVTESVGEALDHLKSVSGGLALRMARQTSKAVEAVALAVTVAWLKGQGELLNSILIPVDAHSDLFVGGERRKPSEEGAEPSGQTGGALRCDLIQVRVTARKLEVTFIEVKSRSNVEHITELLDRMCDQIEASEERFRSLFFDPESRVDHVLQRSRLAVLLRFYAQRAWRYGFFESEEKFRETLDRLDSLESGLALLQVDRRGYVVSLSGKRQAPISHRGAKIRILTAADFEERTSFRPVAAPSAEEEAAKADESLASPVGATSVPFREERSEPAADTPVSRGENDGRVQATAPPEGDVTVPLGRSQGTEVLWKCSVVGSPHVFILGIPGQGKSVTVNRLVCHAASLNLPSLIIDFHGQFSAADSAYRRTVQPRVWDVAEGLPFTPFEASRSAGDPASFWKTNSFAVAEIFQYIFELGDIQRGLIYEAMRECYRNAGFDSNEGSPLPTMDDLERQIQRHEKKEGVKNVLVRCKPVFDFHIFRETARTGAWELLQACQPGLVVDLRRQPLEQVQIAAAAFLLRKVYKDMFRWGETEQPRLLIALDEAHRVARDTTLPRIMKEGRKFGVVVISASQNLTDFHPEVLGNAGTKIVFRTNYPASRKVAGFLRGRKGPDMPGIVEQLPVGVAMVQTLEMPYAERVQMYRFDPE